MRDEQTKFNGWEQRREQMRPPENRPAPAENRAAPPQSRPAPPPQNRTTPQEDNRPHYTAVSEVDLRPVSFGKLAFTPHGADVDQPSAPPTRLGTFGWPSRRRR